MTQNNLNNEINRELEKLDNEFGFSAMDGAMDELRHSLCSIAEKTVEAVRVGSYLSPHVPPEGFQSKYPRCEDCFCSEQADHTHNSFIKEQYKKAKEWLGEDV